MDGSPLQQLQILLASFLAGLSALFASFLAWLGL